MEPSCKSKIQAMMLRAMGLDITTPSPHIGLNDK